MANSPPLVCLDANLLIDLYLGRPRSVALSKLILSLSGQLAVSALSVDICSYIAQKDQDNFSLNDLKDFVEDFIIFSVTSTTVLDAFTAAKDSDLEDAIQVVCAKQNEVDIFLTADKKLAHQYKDTLNIVLV